jgi:hypothetical protein
MLAQGDRRAFDAPAGPPELDAKQAGALPLLVQDPREPSPEARRQRAIRWQSIQAAHAEAESGGQRRWMEGLRITPLCDGREECADNAELTAECWLVQARELAQRPQTESFEPRDSLGRHDAAWMQPRQDRDRNIAQERWRLGRREES